MCTHLLKNVEVHDVKILKNVFKCIFNFMCIYFFAFTYTCKYLCIYLFISVFIYTCVSLFELCLYTRVSVQNGSSIALILL